MGETQEIMDILLRIRTLGLDAAQKTAKAIQDVSTVAERASSVIRRQADEYNRATNASKRFRFELLSTMFAGMALKNTMFGLLQPAMQTSGVFEVLTSTLEILFLPIALFLLDYVFLPMMDFFTGLPEPVQGAIGALVLIIGVAGAAIAILSQIGMLMSGGVVASFLGFVSTLLGPVIAGISGFVTAALSLIAGLGFGWILALGLILLGVLGNIDGIVKAFSDLFSNLLTAGASFFSNLFQVFTGALDLIVGIIHGFATGDWSKAWNAVLKIVDGIVGMVKDLLFGVIGSFLKFGADLIGAIAQGVINSYGVIKNAIKGIPFIGPLLAGALGVGEGIVGGAGNLLAGVLKALKIPGFAEGGIVTKPTLAMIGEKGPEAVVPLGGSSAGGGTTNIGSVTIPISTGSISSDFDLRRLGEAVNRGLYRDYNRQTFGR